MTPTDQTMSAGESERERFEQWALSDAGGWWPDAIVRVGDCYNAGAVTKQWVGWQARAALPAAAPAAQSSALPHAEQSTIPERYEVTYSGRISGTYDSHLAAKLAHPVSRLRYRIQSMPARMAWMGGQWTAYLSREEALGWVDECARDTGFSEGEPVGLTPAPAAQPVEPSDDARDAAHAAISRALLEGGVTHEVLVGMCLEVGLEAFDAAFSASKEPPHDH